MHISRATLGTAILASSLFGALPAFASTSTRAAGTVNVWIVQNANVATSPILLTGAIGDHGTATNVDKNGKTDQNGEYVKIDLKKGTFEVNAVALDQSLNKAQPTLSNTTCSGEFTGSAPVTLYNGTGSYKGINGSLTITVTGAFELPRFKNGSCNETQKANPVAQYSTITGSGAVTFG